MLSADVMGWTAWTITTSQTNTLFKTAGPPNLVPHMALFPDPAPEGDGWSQATTTPKAVRFSAYGQTITNKVIFWSLQITMCPTNWSRGGETLYHAAFPQFFSLLTRKKGVEKVKPRCGLGMLHEHVHDIFTPLGSSLTPAIQRKTTLNLVAQQ